MNSINHGVVNAIAEHMRIKGVDRRASKYVIENTVYFAWGSLDSRYADIEIKPDGTVSACLSPHPESKESVYWNLRDDEWLKAVDALDDYYRAQDTPKLREMLKKSVSVGDGTLPRAKK